MKTLTFKTKIQNAVLTIAASMLIVSCGSSSTEEDQDHSNEENTSSEEVVNEETQEQIVMDLDNSTFQTYLNEKEGVLIDVRTAEEYSEGHIDGAVNKDFLSGEFEASIDSLDKDKPVFVYCQAGGRSGKARDILKNANFSEIYNLENGYGNWDK